MIGEMDCRVGERVVRVGDPVGGCRRLGGQVRPGCLCWGQGIHSRLYRGWGSCLLYRIATLYSREDRRQHTGICDYGYEQDYRHTADDCINIPLIHTYYWDVPYKNRDDLLCEAAGTMNFRENSSGFCRFNDENRVWRKYICSPMMYIEAMEVPGLRTWVIFYLISFVVLLWAAFLTVNGVMLWVSLMLVIVVVGINFVTVYNQIKAQASRKALQAELTKNIGKDAKVEVDNRQQH